MAEEKKENFETRMKRLQTIVTQLEEGTLPLEQGMALYKEGIECAKICTDLLENARHELTVWKDGQEVPLDLQKTSEP